MATEGSFGELVCPIPGMRIAFYMSNVFVCTQFMNGKIRIK